MYTRGWAGKNEGWVTSNSGQSEGVINKSAYKERGLPDFLFLFYFQTNTFSALGTNHTWFPSPRKANQFITESLKLIKKTDTISMK